MCTPHVEFGCHLHQITVNVSIWCSRVQKLLRLVGGFTPTVGKIYYKCLTARLQHTASAPVLPSTAKNSPSKNMLQNGQENCCASGYVADWGYLHCDMHSIGYLLDPEYHAHNKGCTKGMWDEFVRGATRMLKALGLATPGSQLFSTRQCNYGSSSIIRKGTI